MDKHLGTNRLCTHSCIQCLHVKLVPALSCLPSFNIVLCGERTQGIFKRLAVLFSNSSYKTHIIRVITPVSEGLLSMIVDHPCKSLMLVNQAEAYAGLCSMKDASPL